jgi:hypothetical protein
MDQAARALDWWSARNTAAQSLKDRSLFLAGYTPKVLERCSKVPFSSQERWKKSGTYILTTVNSIWVEAGRVISRYSRRNDGRGGRPYGNSGAQPGSARSA